MAKSMCPVELAPDGSDADAYNQLPNLRQPPRRVRNRGVGGYGVNDPSVVWPLPNR